MFYDELSCQHSSEDLVPSAAHVANRAFKATYMINYIYSSEYSFNL